MAPTTASQGRRFRRVAAVDLFCGVGGLTHGLRAVGIPVVAGFDIDPDCKFPYEANNPPARFVLEDVANLDAEDLACFFPNDALRVLVGCAPCQPFSLMGKGRADDGKWKLLSEFGELVKELRPEVASMENVPPLKKHKVYADFARLLEKEGYHVAAEVVYGPDYGVPQQRRRLLLLASLLGPIDLVGPITSPNRYRTVKHAIGGLGRLQPGQRSHKDPIHYAADLKPINLRRISASKPGGSWEDWPRNLRLDCHRKKTGKTYRSVYGRMEWGKPSPVITTKFFNLGSGRFGHPSQDRAISLREGALLQTFPKSYRFVPRGSEPRLTQVGALIGNAVPVRLGEAVGISIRRHLREIAPELAFPNVPARWAKVFQCGRAKPPEVNRGTGILRQSLESIPSVRVRTAGRPRRRSRQDSPSSQ